VDTLDIIPSPKETKAQDADALVILAGLVRSNLALAADDRTRLFLAKLETRGIIQAK
jgi:hypothetical protein